MMVKTNHIVKKNKALSQHILIARTTDDSILTKCLQTMKGLVETKNLV